MKMLSFISTVALFALLGISIPAYAQKPKPAPSKPATHSQTAPKPAAKPAPVTRPAPAAKPAPVVRSAQPQVQSRPSASTQTTTPQPRTKPQANTQGAVPNGGAGLQNGPPIVSPGPSTIQNHNTYTPPASRAAPQTRSSYHAENFGREHRAHFGRGGGRYFGGHREFFFGGFWFYYPGYWPAWFYGDDVYFVIGPDGFWYAHSYNHPDFFIRVEVE